MRHQQREYYDDDAIDERGILRDGKSVRVSLFMRDADSLSPVQRAIARESLGLHRPGFRLADADTRTTALDKAYSDYETNLTSAYKNAAVERTERSADQQTLDAYADYDKAIQGAWRA